MPTSDKQRILNETSIARDEAEVLLRTLQEAKAQTERHLAEIKRSDPIKQVTGRSSLDKAIAETQRAIDAFNRVIQDIRKESSDLTLP